MNANGPRKSVDGSRRARRRGFTLIEVVVSIAVVMALVMAGLAARYLTVKQAVRADAYNTAGRLAQLLLEGWRSTEPELYDPTGSVSALSNLSPTVTIVANAPGCPAAPTGFTTLNTYRVIADRKNFYVRLAYKPEDTSVPGSEHPAMLHVVVAFLDGYLVGDASASTNRVSLTTYR
jgi:prepilin-type N-terminal cleavage/methylation domain-containing protein